ncbi:MAG: AI-2E family transporter [Candidatus Gastranaerophilales bacterium]|nr:AI-2E family transporter [Candidatus Gastranaerophilales bacterium]
MENMFRKLGNSQNLIFLIGIIIYIICLFTITDIALMLFVTYVIACALNPIVDKLEKKCSRQVAATVVFGGFVGGILLMFLPIIFIGGKEIAHLAAQYPQYVDQAKDYFTNSPVVQEFANSGGLIASITSISKGGLYIFVAMIFTYFLILDREKLLNAVLRFFPSKSRGRIREIVDISESKLSRFVSGQFIASASVGLIMIIGLMLLKVDSAIILGCISAVLDIVPIVGPAIALVICIAVVYKLGWTIVILTAIIFAIAQIAENNIVKPYVFGKFMDLHPIVIYIFLFVCAKYFGAVGAIFAPAIAADTCVLIEELYLKNMDADGEQ